MNDEQKPAERSIDDDAGRGRGSPSDCADVFSGLSDSISLERAIPLASDDLKRGYANQHEVESLLCIFTFDGQLDARQRLAFSKKIIDAGAAAKLLVFPLILDHSEWKPLQSCFGEPSDGEVLPMGYRARYTVSYSKQVGTYPTLVREHVLHLIRASISLLDSTAIYSPTTQFLFFPALVRAIHEVFDYLFAVADLEYKGDCGDIAEFNDKLLDGEYFKETDIYLVPFLLSLADQARLMQFANQSVDPGSYAQVSKLVRDFFRRSRRYFRHALTTTQEKKQDRTRRLAFAGVFSASIIGALVLLFFLVRPTAIGTPVQIHGNPGGITAAYYAGQNFGDFAGKGVTEKVTLPPVESPYDTIGKDNYSVRWEGFLAVRKTGKQVVCADSDDGVRVYIAGNLLIDEWTVHVKRRDCARFTTDEVGWYPLKVEFFEAKGRADMELLLGKSEEAVSAVEPSQLCCR